MNISEIQKKKEALRNQMAELDAQAKKLARLEREKAAERLKKNYENNRDALAAILFKLHAKDFADFNLVQMRADVTAILNPQALTPSDNGKKAMSNATESVAGDKEDVGNPDPDDSDSTPTDELPEGDESDQIDIGATVNLEKSSGESRTQLASLLIDCYEVSARGGVCPYV